MTRGLKFSTTTSLSATRLHPSPTAGPLTAATTASDPAPGLVVGDPATTGEIVSSITGLGLARLCLI